MRAGGEAPACRSQVHDGADDVAGAGRLRPIGMNLATGAVSPPGMMNAVILLGNSPGAIALTVTPSRASFFASVALRWCTAALAG